MSDGNQSATAPAAVEPFPSLLLSLTSPSPHMQMLCIDSKHPFSIYPAHFKHADIIGASKWMETQGAPFIGLL